MDIFDILQDKTLKGVARRQAVIESLIDCNCNNEVVATVLQRLDPKLGATVLEAIEEITNKGLGTVSSEVIATVIPYISSDNNNCRREASRIIGNLAKQYPTKIADAIPSLMANTSDEGTVIRWSAAYALSRIAVLPEYCQTSLSEDIEQLTATETDNAIRNQYVKAATKIQKLRKSK